MPARPPVNLIPFTGITNDNAGQGTIAQIYAAMAALEQAAFTSIDVNFHAYDFVPDFGNEEVQYPYSFRFPPKWNLQDRRMGAGTDKPWAWRVEAVILVGPSAPNQIGALTALTEPFIVPFYELYEAHRSVMLTVRNLRFDHADGYMGDVILNGVKHFGAQFPIILEQSRHFPGA